MSTTAAANAFVPLSTIMSMADWSSALTFRTFYCKPRKVDLQVNHFGYSPVLYIKSNSFVVWDHGCFISLSSSVKNYHLFSHIFRTESVKYDENYTRAAQRPEVIIQII